MKVLQTLLILLLAPFWLLRAVVLCTAGVALIIGKSLCDVWAPSGVSQPARRKPT